MASNSNEIIIITVINIKAMMILNYYVKCNNDHYDYDYGNNYNEML